MFGFKRTYSSRLKRERTMAWYWGCVLTLFAVSVLSILIAPLIPKIPPANPRTQEVERCARPVLVAIQEFYERHGNSAPEDARVLVEYMAGKGSPGVLPLDPWGRPLLYVNEGDMIDDTYVVSLGADGRKGGGGVDRDVYCAAGLPIE